MGAAKEAKEAAKRRAKRLAYEKANPVKAWKPKPQPLSRMAKMFMAMRNFKIPKKAAAVVKKVIKKVVKKVVKKSVAKKARQSRRRSRRTDMVWAVNRRGSPYYRRGRSGRWTHVPGVVKQVSNGPVGTFCVNRKDAIYYRLGTNENNNSGGHGWQRIPGTLKQISASTNSDAVWGVNKRGTVYCKLGASYRWQRIPGTLVQVEIGNAGVYGVNRHGAIYYRKGTYGRPTSRGCGWTRIPGTLKNIGVGRNGIWGVNRHGAIYTRTHNSGWTQIPGRYVNISSF